MTYTFRHTFYQQIYRLAVGLSDIRPFVPIHLPLPLLFGVVFHINGKMMEFSLFKNLWCCPTRFLLRDWMPHLAPQVPPSSLPPYSLICSWCIDAPKSLKVSDEIFPSKYVLSSLIHVLSPSLLLPSSILIHQLKTGSTDFHLPLPFFLLSWWLFLHNAFNVETWLPVAKIYDGVFILCYGTQAQFPLCIPSFSCSLCA